MALLDYSVIDCEIRTLVGALNAISGIRTLFSCAGHKDGQEAYVSFECDNAESLALVVAQIEGRRSEVFENRFLWATAVVEVTAHPTAPGVMYTIRINGQPTFFQRLFMEQIEKRFIALRGTHLPCSKDASVRSADIPPNC